MTKRSGAASARARRVLPAEILAVVTVVLLAELARAFMPLAHALAEEADGFRGYLMAGAVVLVVFAALALAVPAGAVRRERAVVIAAAVVLVGARMAIQFIHPIPVWLGAVALGAGVAGGSLVLGTVRLRQEDGVLLIWAIVGLALDTAVRGAFGTWDIAWRNDVASVAVALTLAVIAVLAAIALEPPGRARRPPAPRLALFGPFFAVQLLVLQNPGAVASRTGVSLVAATAIVLVADASALAIAGVGGRLGRTSAVVLTVVGSLGAFGLSQATGILAAGLFVAEQCILVLLMLQALADVPVREEPRPHRVAGWAVAGLLGFLALAFLDQPPTRYRLPFPSGAIAAAAFAVVGTLAIVRRPIRPARVGGAIVSVPLALLAVPAAVWWSSPDPDADAAPRGSTVRVMTYNIHGAVDVDAQVDPAAIARVIAAQDPDVVVLQEVARGWPVFGTLDVLEWLSERLDMDHVYAPAADDQFGNAILTRLPIEDAGGGLLPLGGGRQERGYVAARVQVRGGELSVIGVHLEGTDDAPGQVDRLLAMWDGNRPAVIAGDMNMQPDDVGLVRSFLDAGLRSVQDEMAPPCERTVSEAHTDDPCARPDWIFATTDLAFDEFVIVRAPVSDHYALAVTVTI